MVVSSLHIFHCMSKELYSGFLLFLKWGGVCCLNKTDPYHRHCNRPDVRYMYKTDMAMSVGGTLSDCTE